jgi:phenylacetate-CoA ligase
VRPWYTDAGSGINGLVPIGAEDVKRQTMSVPSRYQKAAYEHLRAAHLNAVRASLEDHVARLEWSPEQIERYRTPPVVAHFARERSPFHASRLAHIDPATA